MPRSMLYTVDVGVPTEALYRDLTTIAYWEDLVEKYRQDATRTEIGHFSTGDTGTDVSFVHILTAADLPAVARPVVPGTFVVTREQHFDPFEADAGQAIGRYRALVPTVPVEIEGDYVLRSTPGGSQMEIETRCSVRVPIIGKQIESVILGGLKSLFANEGEYTAAWVTAHH